MRGNCLSAISDVSAALWICCYSTTKQLVPNLMACWLTLKSSTTMSDPPEAYSRCPEISVAARCTLLITWDGKDNHFLPISLLRNGHPLQSSRAGVGLGVDMEKELSWHSQSRLHFSALGEKRQHSSWICIHHLVSKSHKHDFWLVIPLYNKSGTQCGVQWNRKVTWHGKNWWIPPVLPWLSHLHFGANCAYGKYCPACMWKHRSWCG